MDQLLRAAASVSSAWSLAAFAIAAVLYFAQRQRKGSSIPQSTYVGISGIVLLGLAPIGGALYVQLRTIEITEPGRAIYRLRVSVIDPEGRAVDEASVSNSLGNYAIKSAGAWLFEIPAASRPADGRLTVYAAVDPAFLRGKGDVALADDRNPAVTIRLEHDTSGQVRGIVVNADGVAVSGARVSVVGHGSSSVITGDDGSFVLPAYASKGQQVELHAQKGKTAVTQWHPTGDSPATIMLK